MIVEDDVILRINAVDFAEEAGFIALEAGNADDAVLMLERNSNIRLVFTDIEMPGSMNGLKLAEVIRNRWPPLGLIITSEQPPRESASIPKGGVFCAKPYRGEQIVGAMRALIAPEQVA